MFKYNILNPIYNRIPGFSFTRALTAEQGYYYTKVLCIIIIIII
jgi:hypothetical protein